ncbi:hypothetical protein Q0N71_29160 [Bacillus thuringiensis]|uniref:hypothetical protein n=1 Tax=Bacillus thuringiensis TaxID=1428 RepID=UPI00345A562D
MLNKKKIACASLLAMVIVGGGSLGGNATASAAPIGDNRNINQVFDTQGYSGNATLIDLEKQKGEEYLKKYATWEEKGLKLAGKSNEYKNNEFSFILKYFQMINYKKEIGLKECFSKMELGGNPSREIREFKGNTEEMNEARMEFLKNLVQSSDREQWDEYYMQQVKKKKDMLEAAYSKAAQGGVKNEDAIKQGLYIMEQIQMVKDMDQVGKKYFDVAKF